MPHKNLLVYLLQQQQIFPINIADKALRIAQEQYGLQRLKQKKNSYLSNYDQLFRLVSLWLLQHDYDLTQQQPHQVFKAVVHFHCSHLHIESMIQHRHQLKKGLCHQTNISLWDDLRYCHDELSQVLQAYNLIEN